MTRPLVGGTPADHVGTYTSGGQRNVGPAVATWWSFDDPTVQLTDLLTLDGDPVTSVRLGSEGLIPPHYWPDEVKLAWLKVSGIAEPYLYRVNEGPAGPVGAPGAPGGSDAETAQRINEGPLTKAALGGAVATQAMTHVSVLAPWLRRLRESPLLAKIGLVGDSTYDSGASGLGLHNAVKAHITPGGLLEGMVDAGVLNHGRNGATTAVITNAANMALLAAAAPDLIIAGPGINDVRQRVLTTHTEDVTWLRAILVTGFNAIRKACPGVPIIASMPNSFTTTDVGGAGYVVNGNPQECSAILRDAYLSLIAQWPDVLVHDTQEEVFGTVALATSPYMADQIHPSNGGYNAKIAALAPLIGRLLAYSTGRAAAARLASPYAPWTIYGREVEDTSRYVLVASGLYVGSAGGEAVPSQNRYVDFNYSHAASANIQRNDLIEMPDGTTFRYTGSRGTPGADRLRITDTGVPLSHSNPPATAATNLIAGRGTVRVWRRRTAIAVPSTPTPVVTQSVIADTASWRFKRIGVIATANTDLANAAQRVIDINAASVTAEAPSVPASDWAVATGDRVYIDGMSAIDAAEFFTIGTDGITSGAQGPSLRLTGMSQLNRSALVGRLAVVVGTHA
ncbi:SGNH/GDSL hydrolase family protein [Nocardioides alkalitolerans]|uniref:SGNH/GDSL hydrolase family protein n=1 Tax=Nocardioides alkalitolerans TaxID=281714 RepID=UPI000417CB4A|nr:SGNH/GDSL hydrolase family protein [Nocardioides alkalitolerans]